MRSSRKVVLAEVRAVRELSAHMRRITLQLDDLAGYVHEGPDQLVRVFFPLDHQRVPVLPPGDDWWPANQALPEDIRPPIRNYTVRRFDPTRREVDIDFVLHGDVGPGTRWGTSARPGDRIGLLSDGCGYVEPAGTTARILVADESALPAVGAIVESLPAGAKASVFVEVYGPAEEQRFETAADVDVTWIHRGHGADGSGARAVERLAGHPVAAAGLYAWVSGEAGLVKAVRRHLVDRGVPKKKIYFCGYWLHKRNDNEAFLAEVDAELAEAAAQQ